MKREYIIYIVFVSLLLALYFFVQSGKPAEAKRVSWLPSFSKIHDRPFGAELLYERLEDLFEDQEFATVRKATYRAMVDSSFWSSTAYIVINNNFLIDRWDTEVLMDFVAEGNHALIAAENISSSLQDSLGFRNVTASFQFLMEEPSATPDSLRGNFVDSNLKDDWGYDFAANNVQGYFSIVDSSKTEVICLNNQKLANVIRVQHGGGSFILVSSPYLLTNYHLLYENHHDFIAKVFSHIPPYTNILWDEYYKVEYQGGLDRTRGGSGDLSVILGEKELAWAWYLIVFALIIYVLVERKRKQRIIPIIKPHPNMTLDFVETIGRIYFQQQNHKNIAEKKIKVLLEYIRTRYFLKTHQIDEDFIQSLAGKSDISQGDLIALFNMIKRVRRQPQITEDLLIELNEMIDLFYAKSPR